MKPPHAYHHGSVVPMSLILTALLLLFCSGIQPRSPPKLQARVVTVCPCARLHQQLPRVLASLTATVSYPQAKIWPSYSLVIPASVTFIVPGVSNFDMVLTDLPSTTVTTPQLDVTIL